MAKARITQQVRWCACGCGEHVMGNSVRSGSPRRFVSGHNLRLLERSPEHCRKIGDAQRNAWQTKRKRKPLGSTNLDVNGYVRVKVVEGNGRWCPEHTLVIEEAVGRKLEKGELVHHINLTRDDNRLENLYLCSDISEHHRVHASADRLLKHLIHVGTIRFNRESGEYETVL